jgi:nucleotide-binding universal stress UspA family protein
MKAGRDDVAGQATSAQAGHDPVDRPMSEADLPDQGLRVVVGVDGSAESRAALAWAVEHVRARGGRIDAVAVWQSHVQFGHEGLSPVPTDEFAVEARAWLSDALAQTGAKGVRTHLEHGKPVAVLLGYAQECDLLVLGNRGRGALAGAFVGSVALHAVHHARCPVVLVPAPPDGA